MSFYYVNINEFSRKRVNLNVIISECNPHIVCLVETKLSLNVKVIIPGYYIIKKSKNALSGGIIIAIKEEISSKCIETTEIKNNRILSLRIDTEHCNYNYISIWTTKE